MERFWSLRREGDPDQGQQLKDAVLAALSDKDPTILSYLLSRNCPWDPLRVSHVLNTARCYGATWGDWHDTLHVAFRYKLPCAVDGGLLMHVAQEKGDLALLETVQKSGYHL